MAVGLWRLRRSNRLTEPVRTAVRITVPDRCRLTDGCTSLEVVAKRAERVTYLELYAAA